jgi:hypothetical protein
MSTKVLTIAAAIILCGVACVPKSPPEKARADGGAALSVAEAIHDFGAVTEGDKLKHTFVLASAADLPIGIARVETTAPWVTAELKTKQIPPGGKGEVEVSFDTLDHVGDLEKRITVVSGDPSAPKIQLYVRARVAPLIAIEKPEEEEEDEFMHLGDKMVSELKIVGPKAAVAHLAIKTVTSPDVSAELIPAQDAGASPTLRVTVRGTALGHFHAGVILDTGIESKPTIAHFFEWAVLGNVTVAPRALHFEIDRSAPQDRRDETVARISSRIAGFEVRAAKSDSKAFTADLRRTAKPGDYELRVTVADRDAFHRTERANVVLSTNDKVEPSVNVPITVSRTKPRKATPPTPSSSRPHP